MFHRLLGNLRWVALVVVPTLAVIYAFEGYLITSPSSLSKQNEISRLKLQGIEAFPTIPLAAWYLDYFRGEIDAGKMPLALGGVSNVRTVFCREKEGWIDYDADRYGFRNSKRSDVVVVGDSFAKGACVRKPVASLLGAMTFSAEQSGPLFTLATLLEYALPERPQAVIWMFYEGNDLADLKREATSSLLLSYLDGRTQDLRTRQDEIDASLRAGTRRLDDTWASFIRLQRLRALLGLLGVRSARSPQVDLAVLPTLARTLKAAVKATRAAGARFLFVYIPAPDRLAGDSNHLMNIEREVMSIACAAGAEPVPIEWGSNPLQFYTSFPGQYGHWNEAGTRHVADAIAQALAMPGPALCDK
jgi:hypothetical protein